MSHLDGNAAAGELCSVFGSDLTTAVATCAECGLTGPVAAVRVYSGPGTVLRCPGCDAVLLRVVNVRGEVALEMRGVRVLRWRP